jgi:hypothetical protein
MLRTFMTHLCCCLRDYSVARLVRGARLGLPPAPKHTIDNCRNADAG